LTGSDKEKKTSSSSPMVRRKKRDQNDERSVSERKKGKKKKRGIPQSMLVWAVEKDKEVGGESLSLLTCFLRIRKKRRNHFLPHERGIHTGKEKTNCILLPSHQKSLHLEKREGDGDRAL